MAALHAGRISFDCSQCDDPKIWSCEAPSPVQIWNDGSGEVFYSCPRSFVTDDILEWYKMYEYYKEFNAAPSYDKQSNRFIEAWVTYRHYYNKYEAEVAQMKLNKQREKYNG